MKNRLTCVLGALSAIVFAASRCPATPVFTTLTPAGPTYTTMQIVGVSGDGKFAIGQMSNATAIRATRWTVDNSARADLGLLGSRPYSQGTFLDSNGAIATADALDGSFNPQIFRWTAPSTQLAIPFMGTGTYTYSAGLSSDGSVIAGWGNTTSASSPQRVDRWTAATGATIVPLPAGIISTVTFLPDQQNTRALSGNGNFIIANTINATSNVGFRYDATTGVSTDIGQMQAGQVPHLTSISNDGSTIIGYSNFTYPDQAFVTAGFIWTQNGGFVNLGFIGPENGQVLPRYFSGNGQVVLGTDGGVNFIWTPSTGMRSFDSFLAANGVTTGMTSLILRGISDDGTTIVGMGTTSTGDFRGWSLANVTAPEPGTLSLVAMSGVLLLARRARRVA